MIYAVEQPHILDESTSNYKILGESAEVAQFKDCLAALAVEATANGSIETEQAYRFLGNLAGGVIHHSDKATLSTILSDRIVLRNERLRRLTNTAAYGHITSSDLMEEFELFEGFEPDQEPYYWLNSDGLHMNITDDGALEVGVGEIDDSFEDTEISVAKELGLKEFAWQQELVNQRYIEPSVLSYRNHITLGSTNNAGVFVPVVTVLGNGHPAVYSEMGS